MRTSIQEPLPQSQEAAHYNPIEQPPTSYAEALERVTVAREIDQATLPPEVDLPDTPARTFAESVTERTDRYWLDREDLSTDTSIGGLLDKIDAPTPELKVWAVQKAKAAQLVWAERTAGDIFLERHPDAVPDGMTLELARASLHSEEKDALLVQTLLGQIRVVIKDGEPVIVANDFSATTHDAVNAINRHIEDWDERHQRIVSSAPRIAAILRTASVLKPFSRKPNPNEPGSIAEAGMLVYLANQGRKSQGRAA